LWSASDAQLGELVGTPVDRVLTARALQTPSPLATSSVSSMNYPKN